MASKTAGYHESSSSMQARLEEESAPVEAKRRDEATVSDDNDPTGVSDNESSDDCSVFTATTLTLVDDETAA